MKSVISLVFLFSSVCFASPTLPELEKHRTVIHQCSLGTLNESLKNIKDYDDRLGLFNLYCTKVKDQYFKLNNNKDITEKSKEKIRQALNGIMEYRDALYKEISACAPGFSNLNTCDQELIDNAKSFAVWYWDQIKFLYKLSCVSDSYAFSYSDVNLDQGNAVLNLFNLKLIDHSKKRTEEIAQNIQSGAHPLDTSRPGYMKKSEQEKEEAAIAASEAFSMCREKLNRKGSQFEAIMASYSSQLNRSKNNGKPEYFFDIESVMPEKELRFYVTKKLKNSCYGLAQHAFYRMNEAERKHKEIRLKSEKQAASLARVINVVMSDINNLCSKVKKAGDEIERQLTVENFDNANLMHTPEGIIVKTGNSMDSDEFSRELDKRLKNYIKDPKSKLYNEYNAAWQKFIALFSSTQIYTQITDEERFELFKKPNRTKEEEDILQNAGMYIKNPLPRLMSTKSFTTLIGIENLNGFNFRQACFLEGKVFKNFTIKDKKDPLDDGNHIIYGKDLIKAEDEITKNFEKNRHIFIDDMNTCILGPDPQDPQVKIQAQTTSMSLYDEKEIEEMSSKYSDDQEDLAKRIDGFNQKRMDIINRYVQNNPILVMDYIVNVKDADFGGFCPALLYADSKLKKAENINTIMDVVTVGLIFGSFFDAPVIANMAKYGFVAIGIIDGNIIVNNIIDLNEEMDFIEASVHSGFLSPQDSEAALGSLRSQKYLDYLSAGFDLLLIGSFTKTGVKYYWKLVKEETVSGAKKVWPIIKNVAGSKSTAEKVAKEGVTAGKAAATTEAEKAVAEAAPKKEPKINPGAEKITNPSMGTSKFKFKNVSKAALTKNKSKVRNALKKVLPTKYAKAKVIDFFADVIAGTSARTSNFFNEMSRCRAAHPKRAGKAIAITTATDLGWRNVSSLVGYTSNLGSNDFEWGNIGGDMVGTSVKGTVIPIISMRQIKKNAVKVEMMLPLDENIAINSAKHRIGKSYSKSFTSAGVAELISGGIYYFSGTAEKEYGKEYRTAASERALFGVGWAVPSILLKMTIYDFIMGMTCVIPGMKAFAHMKDGAILAIQFVPPMVAQGAYSLSTSYAFYMLRLGFLHSVGTYSTKEKYKQENFSSIAQGSDVEDVKLVEGVDIDKMNKEMWDDLKGSKIVEIEKDFDDSDLIEKK